MHPELKTVDDYGAHTLSPLVVSEEVALHAFVTFVACSGNHLYVGLGNRSVLVYKIDEGLTQPQRSAFAVGGLPICAVVNPAHNALLIGTDNSQLLELDHALTTKATLSKGWVEQLAVGACGLCAYSSGKTAYVIDSDGVPVYELAQSQGTVTGLQFSPDGMQLALARYGGVAVYAMETGEQTEELEWRGAHLNLAWSPDGRYLVTATPDKEVHFWDLSTKKNFRMSGYPAKIRSLCWTADGKHLAAAGADSVTVWPFVSGNPSGKPPYEFGYSFQGIVTQVAAHPSEAIIAGGYSNGTVLIGRYLDGEAIIARAPQGHAISALAWSEDGNYLFAGTESGEFSKIALKQTEF